MEMAYDTQTASVNRFAANQSVSASVQGLVDIIVVTSLKVYILLLCLASILKAKYVAFMICGLCVQNLERIPLSHIILCHMCVIQSSTTQATLLLHQNSSACIVLHGKPTMEGEPVSYHVRGLHGQIVAVMAPYVGCMFGTGRYAGSCPARVDWV